MSKSNLSLRVVFLIVLFAVGIILYNQISNYDGVSEGWVAFNVIAFIANAGITIALATDTLYHIDR